MAKQTIEIRLYLSELIYDVQQKTFLVGDLMKTDENTEQATRIQEVIDDKKNVVLRSFGNSLSALKSELSEYLVENNRSVDNLLMEETRKKVAQQLTIGYRGSIGTTSEETEDNTILFLLRVPMNYNLSCKEAVATSLHAYMVNKALADWFGIHAPDMVEYYAQAAIADLVSLRASLNKRIRRARTHLPINTQPQQNELRYE